MILKGSQRGNAARLAVHLMNARDNEQVELHELRGFMSEDDLHAALKEAEAIAKGTRCQQHLFTLSLNPPQDAHVDTATFEAAVELAEQKLGLNGQPHAVVFREKEGRRHAHAVWSRIDTDTMRAKQLSFTKRRLMDLSQELYLQHGWDMPKGMIDRAAKNPLTFTRAEWQQAERAKQDPQVLKALFKDAWQRSDSAESLKAALAPGVRFPETAIWVKAAPSRRSHDGRSEHQRRVCRSAPITLAPASPPRGVSGACRRRRNRRLYCGSCAARIWRWSAARSAPLPRI